MAIALEKNSKPKSIHQLHTHTHTHPWGAEFNCSENQARAGYLKEKHMAKRKFKNEAGGEMFVTLSLLIYK